MRVLTAPVAGIDLPALRRRFAELRAREYPGLDASGDCYLDYTGTSLPPRSLAAAQLAVLDGGLMGNPHSANPASARATGCIEAARDAVLSFFGVTSATHQVVFTANASAAVKLVAEAFPFDGGSTLVLAADNHNSVNGIREYLRPWAARLVTLPLGADLRLAREFPLPPAGPSPSLLAFPAQSNFSGVRHPLGLVDEAVGGGYRVLLDAAAFTPTSPLDLSRIPADFVAVSFYKMFGVPTGVGALIATREALGALTRPWFAGGTVDFVSVQLRRHQWRAGAEAFEDGTPNFLGIAAVPAGLGYLGAIGYPALGAWVDHLTAQLLAGLAALRHPDGGPVVALHGPADTADRGGTVAFTVLDRAGRPVPYPVIEAAAGAERVHVRGGCFCNPGAAEAAFGFPAGPTARCLDSLSGRAFSVDRFADCLGDTIPVGALRASVGPGTSEADIDRLLGILRPSGAV